MLGSFLHLLTHLNYPKVLANSMPKSGTYLLARTLELLGFRHGRHLDIGPYEGIEMMSPEHIMKAKEFFRSIRPGFFATSHFYFYPELAKLIEKFGVKAITIIRDPRDVCVSDVFYILKSQDHRLHQIYTELTPDERLMASIKGLPSEKCGGGPPSKDIGFHFRHYVGWLNYQNGLIIRFEDLIGAQGGGSEQRQRECLNKIIEFLGLNISPEVKEKIRHLIFWEKSKTFRKGSIGSWKEHFKPEHIKAFEEVAGDILEIFGYKSF